jgi:hypothetical protein
MKYKLVSIALVLLTVATSSFGQGKYFYKKKYDGAPLPEYETSKALLPQPILENKPEYIELYNKAWKSAFSNLQSPPEGSALISNWIDEGLCPQLAQWDTSFSIMFGRYADHIFPFVDSHDNFYGRQHDDGMICRILNEADGEDHWWGLGVENARAINPPLYSWAEFENYMVTGDKSRFELILPALEKYAEYIEANRRGYDTPHKLYWSNGQASGMDNTPRDIGRPEPGDGWDCHSAIDHMGWVDMSSQMVIYYKNLAYICNEISQKSKAKKYNAMAQEISDLINKWMWDEERGLYFDVDTNGNKTKWITAATFWPMLAGVSNEEQSARLVQNMIDPNLFWRRVAIPTLAYGQEFYNDNGRYWQGGVWAPTNYMAVQGLTACGYEKQATDLSVKFLDAIWEVYKQTGELWELYSPEMYIPGTNATGVYMCKANYVGWTGLAPISMLIENIIGIRADAIQNKIVWNITQDCVHGIREFRFNKATVSLVATPQPRGYSIEVTSNKPIRLELRVGGEMKSCDIKAGSQTIEV